MYSAAWNELPEVEGLPNNFRRAAAGREMGVNHIRWVHPTELPLHTHPDAEQAIVMLSGQIAFTIDGTELTLRAGDVAIVPRHAVHGGHSIEGEAEFIEVFAPLRIENLVGFLGGPSMPDQENNA
ncbi:cupin domain-containing protein [Aeromicrobium stalagmiti]|uniref:cupin domain-containing protein n=1 Tax=Aeromicrobium stalagmiti TaxID=2738988 RepID=UPI00156890D4|nr:cupin domain-containing protein [Aeromicrobium stalagmiti]NRQ48855.1 cupin domain-containing protein [Aeromicrobium stalagmiti]